MDHPNVRLVREFYDARDRDNLKTARSLLAEDILWHEPKLGSEHTGDLRGPDAILDMIQEAQRRTGGTFRLWLHGAVAHGGQVVAFVGWTSAHGEKTLEGKEIAVYRVRDGKFAEVWFHLDNLEHDAEFWG